MKLALVNRQVILPESGTESFQCHASTLVRLPCGTLVAAWFAGLREGSEDTAIWLSRYEHNIWTTPQRVAAREGEAHWNPVLFYPSDKLWLFYKVGSDVHVWKTWFITSSDRGFTWSTPAPLVNDDILPRGPVKNKLLLASNGAWIAPGSIESPERWRAFVDRSSDEGKHWSISFVPLEPDNAISGTNVALWDGIKRGGCGNVVWKTSCAGMALFSLRCGSLLRGISICCYEAHAGQFFAVIQSTMALPGLLPARHLYRIIIVVSIWLVCRTVR